MPVLLVVAGLASYAATIDLPFVFDDHTSIAENDNIRQLWPLAVAAGAPIQSAIAGRPVANPAGLLLGQHLPAQDLVAGVVAAGRA